MNYFEIRKKLFDKTSDLVQRSLDIRAARRQMISGNVANVETPDYVSKDLPFQKVFERSLEGASVLPLKRTDAPHLPALGEERVDFSWDIEVAPAPGVDIDQQMAKLAARFSLLPIRSYIFTKLDETDEYTSLFNQLVRFKRPLSYLTNGQKVPEDIELASKRKVASLILNRIPWN